jgi:hypothetical protein
VGGHPTAEDMICDLISFQELFSPTTSFPTTLRSGANFLNCKDNIPMVLVLSRGGFCPKDRRQAEGLVQLHRELEVAYCRLVTISTDSIPETNEYRSGVAAHWPSSPMRDASCKKMSTSPNIPILSTIP